MQTANSLKNTEGWESLVGLWDRTHLMRTILWQQQYEDATALLNQYLARLRRFYGVDFCAGGLLQDSANLASSAVPEAGLDRLPPHFARRCLDLVAHARTPISWNEVKAEFGFRSMVVAPIAPPAAEPIGFLMLGHSSRKLYSAAELFVLQSLASELSWVARELNGKRNHREQFTDLSHDVKNTLQSIVSNVGFMREYATTPMDDQREKFLHAIESAVEKITARFDRSLIYTGAEDISAVYASAPMDSRRES